MTHNCKLIEWFNTKHCFCYYIVFAFERARLLYIYANILFHQEKIMNILMFCFICLDYQIELSKFRNKTVKNDQCSGWIIWCKYMIIHGVAIICFSNKLGRYRKRIHTLISIIDKSTNWKQYLWIHQTIFLNFERN